MASYVAAPDATYRSAVATIAKFIRVKLDASGNLEISGAADSEVGTVQRAVSAIGQAVPVRSHYQHQSRIYIASGAISRGAAVYTAAAGKVSASSGGGARVIGHAITSSSADGDQIEVMAQVMEA